MIILPAKITSSQFEWILNLSAELPDQGLYLHPQDYVSLGIPAKISWDIFLSGQKNTDGKNVF
jgi:hypothetical protein